MKEMVMNRRIVLAVACACALAATSVVAQQPGESSRQERLTHIQVPALADLVERAETFRVRLVEAAEAQADGAPGQTRGRSTPAPTVTVPPPPPPPPAPPPPAAPQGQLV